MPKVNPAILIWARKTAGLSVEEAAGKLGLSGPNRLEALESGEREPSRSQLLNMSDKYRRPLLAFYLSEPPREKPRGEDFRVLPKEHTLESEALVSALLRNVQARQQLVRAALEETDEDQVLEFVGSATIGAGADSLVEKLRRVLGVSIEEFRKQKTVTEAFSFLRASVERSGIFVLLMGNLGTHHTNIDVRSFRGFALADVVAPFVVINENDSRAAWSFTLLHELAHIWIGQTGISGYGSKAEVEKFCDSVASRFLLSPEEVKNFDWGDKTRLDDLKKKIDSFSGSRNLSRKMVAYNLLQLSLITDKVYSDLSDVFDAERVSAKQEQEKDRDKDDGGPNYYVVRRHRIGPGLVDTTKRLVAAGALSVPKAGTVLGVKPTAVEAIFGNDRAA